LCASWAFFGESWHGDWCSVLGISKTTVAGCGKKVGGGSALQQGWVHQQQVQSYGASCPSKGF